MARNRTELAHAILPGYANGPDAPIAATHLALTKAETARAIVIVEGISDRIAIETLAMRKGRDLDAEGVAVLPAGGSGAVARYMQAFGPAGKRLALAGLCDADAAETYRLGLIKAGIGNPLTMEDMARLGFHVCVTDLEDELIRAAGIGRVETVIEAQGELGAFRTLQKQPVWREQPAEDQIRRFIRSQARRHLRYAGLLVEAVERIPQPLEAVLAGV